MPSKIVKVKKPAKPVSLSNKEIRSMLKELSYTEISRKRSLNKKYDLIGKSLLQGGLKKAIRDTANAMKVLRRRIPKPKKVYEYLLKTGCFAGHNTIIQNLETMLTGMKATYGTTIDAKKAYAIPGCVLDEFNNVLAIVNNTAKELVADDVLQKLRRLYERSQEYFKDKVLTPPIVQKVPKVKKITKLRASNKVLSKARKSYTKPNYQNSIGAGVMLGSYTNMKVALQDPKRFNIYAKYFKHKQNLSLKLVEASARETEVQPLEADTNTSGNILTESEKEKLKAIKEEYKLKKKLYKYYSYEGFTERYRKACLKELMTPEEREIYKKHKEEKELMTPEERKIYKKNKKDKKHKKDKEHKEEKEHKED